MGALRHVPADVDVNRGEVAVTNRNHIFETVGVASGKVTMYDVARMRFHDYVVLGIQVLYENDLTVVWTLSSRSDLRNAPGPTSPGKGRPVVAGLQFPNGRAQPVIERFTVD